MIRSAPDPHKLWEAERIRNPCKSRTIVTFNYGVKNVSKKTRKKFRDVIIQLLKNIRGWINKVVCIYTRSDIHYTCTFNKFGIMFSVTYILLLTKLMVTTRTRRSYALSTQVDRILICLTSRWFSLKADVDNIFFFEHILFNKSKDWKKVLTTS